nr:DegV family protein [Maliibacterium massiliense]
MIKITADSTCDLSTELLQAWDITLAPLAIVVEDDVYRDGVDITPKEIFALSEAGKVCKTAAVNVAEYTAFFETFLGKYDAVIHINIGQSFSSCHQNAVLAAASLQHVYVVDSANLSTGSGHLVLDAAAMARRGASARQIVDALERTKSLIDASFLIDSTTYLYRGGRCSGVENVGARLLHIKPCIEVRAGVMRVGKKYRGRFDRALVQYVKERLAGVEGIDDSRVFITHSPCDQETVANVRAAVAQYGHFQQIIETDAGCTVSSHCGPNTLGILFKRTCPQ